MSYKPFRADSKHWKTFYFEGKGRVSNIGFEDS